MIPKRRSTLAVLLVLIGGLAIATVAFVSSVMQPSASLAGGNNVAGNTSAMYANAYGSYSLADFTTNAGNGMVVGRDYYHDTTTIPLRDMPQMPMKSPVERESNPNPKTGVAHKDGPDGSAVQHSLAPDAMPAPILNFDGIPFPGVVCSCAPPDTDGAVGATQYVQIVNEGYQVFDKTTGNSLLGPASIDSVWSGFGGVCTSGSGDPVMLYDKLANRWLISQFAGSGGPITDECIAVSTSNDATGTWHRYGFHLGSNFFDYPKIGTWPDAYYMSDNVFNAAGTEYLGPQPFAFNRAAMLIGAAATFVSPVVPLGHTIDPIMPADIDGSILPTAGAPETFVRFPGSGTYNIYHFHVDFITPANSTFTLFSSPAAAAFTMICPNTRACVPESGVRASLDAIGDRMMFRGAYRKFADGHEALVTNYTVSSGGVAGVRWVELDNVTAGPVTVAQESTYQPDTTWRWMASAAMDHNGDIAVGFSASSASIFPQIRYAGRLASDPPNTLAQGETHLFDGLGAQSGSGNRWGDYSDMTVDPVDDCTFWYTQEYYPSGTTQFNWRTRIGNFKFPSCSLGTPTPTVTGTPPTNTPTPIVTPTSTPLPCGTFRILIVYSDTAAPTTLPAELLAEPGVTAVDLFNGQTGTPTLAQLQQYNEVVAFSNTGWQDQTTFGNNVADYIDSGGVFVATNFNWYGSGQSLLGRWSTGGYSPYNNPGTADLISSTLGSYIVGHPLMQGINTLNGYFTEHLTLTSGATQVATYTDGLPLAAVQTVGGHTDMGLNAYLGDHPANFSGQWGKLIVNAARWLVNCSTPTPTNTSTPTPTVTPGGGTPTPTFTPTPCGPTIGWVAVAPGPLDLLGPGSASDGSNAYFAGGYSFSSGGNSAHFARYNVGSNTWTALASLNPDAPFDMSSANYSPTTNKIYDMGGENQNAGLNYRNTSIYDIASNTWTYGTAMPDARGFAASGYYNGNIYIVGGYSTNSVSPAYTQTWQYSIAANTWTTKTGVPAPFGFGGAASAVINGKLYVAGGRDSNLVVDNTLYIYDIASDTWTVGASMPAADNVPGAAVLNGKLYVFGGGTPFDAADKRALSPDRIDTSNATMVYDPTSNTWTAGPSMNSPRSFPGGTAVGNTAVAYGGYNGSTTLATAETLSVASCGTPTPTVTPGGRTPTPTLPFIDINGDVFYTAIQYLFDRGVVNGTDATHYSPAGTSTRGQFAKVVVLGFGLPSYTPSVGQDFTDVPPSYFAYAFIESGFHASILSGFDANSCSAHNAAYPCYLPNTAITRGQLTKLVVNAAQYPLYTPTSGQDFADVPPSNVFYVSIETAAHMGVVNGYPDHSFRPGNNIRRDEMAQIVYKGVITP